VNSTSQSRPDQSGSDLARSDLSCDVLIVGAGIVGLAHATEALDRGLSVIVIDRDSRAVGASVRNFGHCCITAQSGDLLELAQVARERWLRFSGLAGFFSVQSGALAVARTQAELAVLEELAGHRANVELLTAAETAARVGSGLDVLGGAHLADDLRVDPRHAAGALADWLDAQPGVTFLWRTSFFGASGGAAETSRGTITATRTIVCVGHDLDYLYPSLAAEHEVERCALQMLRVAAPAGLRLDPAVLTGTSMLRYPAFTETDAAAQLRAEMASLRPDLVRIGANVMFTQRPDGSLLVGDSHLYDSTHEPFLTEATSDVLLAEVARVLGVPGLSVIERWQGVYASSPQHPFLVEEVAEGVTAVTVTSGVGMTIGFGLANRVAAAIL
jgi:FAD dependent oxidoreductase TIGR03364